MNALADALMTLPDYKGIQEATEYSIVHLYHCGITNALSEDSKINEATRIAYLQELRALRFLYVKLPFEANPYIQDKMTSEVLALIHDVDTM